jgi:hypothetical protein
VCENRSRNSRSLHFATPDFLWTLVALADLMRLSLKRKTHTRLCPVLRGRKYSSTSAALPAGSAFYEAADTIIANFGNASDTEAMTFVAFYLLDGDQELIRMLN